MNLELNEPEIEASEYILGAMMLDSTIIPDIIGILGQTSDAFLRGDYKLIYDAIIACHNSGGKTDPIIVAEELDKRGDLNRAGGAVAINDLQTRIVETENIEFYANIIRDRWIRRQILSACHEITNSVNDGEIEPTVLLNEAQDKILSIGQEQNIALNTREAKSETLNLDTEPPEREWLVKNWLPHHCVAMLTGEGGVGKSYLMLEVVSALAMGYGNVENGFLCHANDFQIPNAKRQRDDRAKIVWATWEDDKDEIVRRLRQIHKHLKWPKLDLISDAIRYVDLKLLGPLWGPELSQHVSVRGTLLNAGHQLMHICENHEAKLLVLDPCAGAFGGNENDRSAVRQFTSFLSGWASENECAVMILAHPPKSESTYSGSTDWLGSVRSLWNLSLKKEKVEDEEKPYYSLTHEKGNYAMIQPEKYLAKAPDSGVWLQASKGEAQDAYLTNTNNQTEEHDDDEI